MDDREDYVDILKEVINSLPYDLRLDGIPNQVRLQGIPTEERLQDVPPERAVLALPIEALRALSAEYIATLPEDVQAEIRRRLKSE